MLSLLELQNQFKKSYFFNENKQLTGSIVNNKLSADQRLQIYHNNLFISLTECLQSVYPTVRKLVGDEFFEATVRQYIRLYPPTSSDMHVFGNQFAEFLIHFPAVQTLQYLPEVAQLDWHYHEVFHEAESSKFDFTKLKNVPENKYGDIRFILHPAARLIAFGFPVIQIWQICHDVNFKDAEVDLVQGGEKILMMRQQLEISFAQLSEGEFALLSAFNAGFHFEKACTLALQAESDLKVNHSLQKHLLCGTITDMHLPYHAHK